MFLRIAYLGLTLGLRTASFFLCVLGLVVLRRHVQKQERGTLANGGTGAVAAELQALRKDENNGPNPEPQTSDYDPERETRLWHATNAHMEQQGHHPASVWSVTILPEPCKWCEICRFWYSRNISWMYTLFFKREKECLKLPDLFQNKRYLRTLASAGLKRR